MLPVAGETGLKIFNCFRIFLNGFPIFLNGIPLSEKSEKIYLRRQVYKIPPFRLRISRHLLPKLRNRHSLPELCNCHLLPKLCKCHSLPPSFVIATMRASHPTDTPCMFFCHTFDNLLDAPSSCYSNVPSIASYSQCIAQFFWLLLVFFINVL